MADIDNTLAVILRVGQTHAPGTLEYDHAHDALMDAISAYIETRVSLALASHAVDWQCVPKVPTPDMVEAGTLQEAYCDSCHGVSMDPEQGYRAMLAAAPARGGRP